MSYKKQELLTLCDQLGSSPHCFVGSALLIFLVFCVVFFLYVVCLRPVLAVSLDCPFLITHSVFSNVYLYYFSYTIFLHTRTSANGTDSPKLNNIILWKTTKLWLTLLTKCAKSVLAYYLCLIKHDGWQYYKHKGQWNILTKLPWDQ